MEKTRLEMRHSLLKTVCLFWFCAVAGAVGMAQGTVAGTPAPSLTGFNPVQGAQGTTVNITFTGNGFVAPALGLQFTPPQGLTVGNLHVVSPTQISAQLQIDSSAPIGAHEVLLTVAGHTLTSKVPFIVTAGAPCGTPGTPPCSSAAKTTAPPALRGFSPTQAEQGATLTVIFTGANFSAPAGVQFTPGAGINVQSTTVVNSTQIQALVTVAADAPLGARAVTLTLGNTNLRAQNQFTVVPATGRQTGAMQILRLVPNQVPAGSQGVELTLEGRNFVPGTLVNFSGVAGGAPDVVVTGIPQYVNSLEMRVVVSVLPLALPGGRDVQLRTPKQETVIGKGMLNVLAAASTKKSGPPPAVKIRPIDLQTFSKGIIRLDAPEWGDHWEGEFENHYGIPLLDDDLLFRWHEQNPGPADYYELRIYARDGTTLLAKKRIDGTTTTFSGHSITLLPTYFRPDAAFLADLLGKVPRPSRLGFLYSGAAFKKPVVVNGKLQKSSTPTGPQLTDGDMQWEVAGFRVYNKNGVVRGQSQSSTKDTSNKNDQADLEIEISDRWPLGAPLAPTGLTCSGAGTGAGLQVTNVADKTVYDDKGKPTSGIDPNNYIGDPWVLSGNFNLSRSPYAAHPNLHQGQKCDGCVFGQVDLVQFDDVFLDWGDGTVQRVSSPPKDAGVMNWNRGDQLSLPPDAKAPYALQHKYQYPGSYTVRVFQLSEADAQHVNVALVAASVDGPGIHPFLQAAVLASATQSSTQGPGKPAGGFYEARFKNAFQSLTSKASPGGLAPGTASALAMSATSPADVAGRAFMIYCHTVTVTTPEDLDADGPLHLKSIDDPDFPGHDARKRLPAPVIRRSQNIQEDGSSAPRLMLASAVQKREAVPPQAIRPEDIGPDAICSTCDDAMMATSAIHYYGRGKVRITWSADGSSSQQTLSIGPSEPRKNLKRSAPGEKQPDIIISVTPKLNSPALQVQPLGMHAVEVEADVVPEPSFPNLSMVVHATLGSILAPQTGSAAAAQALNPSGIAQAQSLLKTLAPPPGSGLPPLKVGVLSPAKQNSSGLGAVQYVNGPLASLVTALNTPPDQHVASKTRHYEVVASDPSQPCKFMFPVKSGGAFEVGGLQGNLTRQGTKYSGTGNLIIHMANASSGGYDLYPPIPVKIENWDVPDGQNVASGSIDVSPKLALAASAPALKGSIDRIQGSAGGELDATLTVTLTDDTLRLPGVEKPPAWSGIASELHSNGDWSKDNLVLPSTLIGWSAFQMKSSSVRLDLSHHDGDAAGPLCGHLSGGDWVGVRFASLAITPYTMDLVSSSSLQPNVTDWGVADSGLCGKLATGAFSAALGDGSVSFASINATASNGAFDAQYKGMDVYVPWLETHLKGDAYLQSGGGKQASINFPLTGSAVSKTYNNIAMKAGNLNFTKQENIGWVVKGDTHLAFSAESKPFAAFDTPVYFGMDGRAYFAKGAGAQDISLGGSSQLGKTPLDLVSAHLTAPTNGTTVLGIQFDTNVHLSEVMPAAEAQINYEIDKSGKNYSASGPANAPFTIDVPYPSGQPSSEAKVHPVYSGDPGSEYSGKVDLGEFGGPPVTGEFRLGYQGGHDYWLTRVSFELGDEGVPLVPPFMNLYAIRGGMGHNFPLTAFKDNDSINNVKPVFDDSFLFMAGLRVGMPDQFTYTLDGDLVIKATGVDAGARMDFHAWLLKTKHDGNGDFQGFFQYASGNFDGRLWGRLDFMNGIAYLDLGSSENNAAVDLHFGNSGPWHIDAGKKEGPRIKGHFLIADADAYLMLSNDGLALGGSEHFDLTVGDDSVASAYVRGMLDMGLAITPQPHITGDFSANTSAGVCVAGVCVSDDLVAQIHAEYAPLDIKATASLPLPWPLSDITFTVHL
jgi:hypothetical protein